MITKNIDNFSFLLDCFIEILLELGEQDLAESIKIKDPLNQNHELSEKGIQVYSILFQLMNMVEENTSIQKRRKLESEGELKTIPGLWLNVLEHLKNSNISSEQISDKLSSLHIEPVLTAHPTEAKRITVLEHHRKIYLLLVKMENSVWTPSELSELHNEIKAELERLFFTGEIYLEKPQIADERNNIIHYLVNVFPLALQELDRRFLWAWKQAGFLEDPLSTKRSFPNIRFGSWVGGDRDGHPLVTAKVTQVSLSEMRCQSVAMLKIRLIDLAKKLSLSSELTNTPEKLIEWNTFTSERLGEKGIKALQRSNKEPWRQAVNLVISQLPEAGENNQFYYTCSDQLYEDLLKLKEHLLSVKAIRIVEKDLQPILRLVQVFGFHLARLDIRQNSSFYESALIEFLDAAGLDSKDFISGTYENRMVILNKELQTSRPFCNNPDQLNKEAKICLELFKVIADEIKNHGVNGLGSLIVSMTRNSLDLLTVYLLARETGIVCQHENKLICQLPVVPLFETIEDLKKAPSILEGFLSHPITKNSLSLWQKKDNSAAPFIQVMIGYSDSNKDGGAFSSLWNLYCAQKSIIETGQKYGVAIQFFHGRGGSVSRGAAPTQRFLNALPAQSVQGGFRMTEQGETIAQKYANLLNAEYNLELLSAGVLKASLANNVSANSTSELEPVLEMVSQTSQSHYGNLIQMDGFITFFRQATPIDVIESSHIGSRPSRRSGKPTLKDLRAIPWVFSWGQARFFLSGWYGIGKALDTLLKNNSDHFEILKTSYTEIPYLNHFIENIKTSFLMTDLKTMKEYSELVEDSDIKSKFMKMILDEHHTTKVMLEKLTGSITAGSANELHKIRYRFLEPLHNSQIEMLRTWRAIEPENKSVLLPKLLLSVNAIASGLGVTG